MQFTRYNPFTEDTEFDFRTAFRAEGDGGGGEGEGGDDGGDDDDDEGDDDGDTGGDKGGEKGKTGGDDFPWDEHNRLKREASERAKTDRQRARREAQEKGEHERLAREEQERADRLEEENAQLRRGKVVTAVAARVKMKYPEDAEKYLEKTEMEDEASAERALERLKERRPELFIKSRTGANDIEEEERTTRREVETGERDDDDDQPVGLDRLRSVKRKDT